MLTKPFIELPLLAAIWGASFIFMKIGAPEFGPVLFMTMRTLVASLFLLPLLYLSKKQSEIIEHWDKMLIVGALNTAIPFVLFGWATLTLSAGNTAVLNGTTPMFGAIIAYFWLKEKLSMSAVLGICIGFLGVYFLMFDKVSGESTHVVLPTLAVMLATTCYGISASYTKKYLEGLSSLSLATGSQVGATFLLLPISLFFLPENIPSSNAVLSVITLGILCTAIAYVLFFRLIKAVGPTKTISVTYLIPVFGIAWGMIFLGETINQWTILGAGLILFGISLTTGIIKSTAINNLFSLKKD